MWWHDSSLWSNGGISTINRPVEELAFKHLKERSIIESLCVTLSDLEIEVLTIEKTILAKNPRLTSETSRLQYIVHALKRKGIHLTGIHHAKAILVRCEHAIKIASEGY